MRKFGRRHHAGAWVVFFVLMLKGIHTIPNRQAYFEFLGNNGHSDLLFRLYMLGWPILSAAVSVLCCQMGWKFREGNWRVVPQPLGMLGQAGICAGLFAAECMVFRWFYPGMVVPGGFLSNVAYMLFVVIVAGFLATSLDGMDLAGEARARREFETQNALLKTRMQLMEASTRLVAAQLDPHALLNTLANGAALVRQDPERGGAMLESASFYLRRLLDASKVQHIQLWQEKLIIEDYLAVEAVRMGDRLRVAWDWPELYDDFSLPPILVQPLVENAIKHGLWPHQTGGELHLSAQSAFRKLILEVRNTGVPLARETRQGATGLDNLRSRLNNEYGPEAKFSLASEGCWTVATLVLPMEQ